MGLNQRRGCKLKIQSRLITRRLKQVKRSWLSLKEISGDTESHFMTTTGHIQAPCCTEVTGPKLFTIGSKTTSDQFYSADPKSLFYMALIAKLPKSSFLIIFTLFINVMFGNLHSYLGIFLKEGR